MGIFSEIDMENKMRKEQEEEQALTASELAAQRDEARQAAEAAEAQKLLAELNEATASPSEDDEEPAEEPADENTDESEAVTITVVGGDSSWSVSKRMQEAGLIESASDFDKYLCQNGYDKRIRLGNYEITKEMSYEQMAKIITGS